MTTKSRMTMTTSAHNAVIIILAHFEQKEAVHLKSESPSKPHQRIRNTVSIFIVFPSHFPNSFLTRIITSSLSGSYIWSFDGISKMVGIFC